MATFSVRISDDLATRFDAAAAVAGGRSGMLRRLIMDTALKGPADRALGGGRRDAARLMVRLGSREAAHVGRAAAGMGLRQSGWVAALVRAHLLGQPTFPRAQELTLIAIQGELRRIGVNVNQIARALNTAVMEGRVLHTELTAIDELRRELRAHMGGLREAFEGNLAGWRVEL